MASSDDEDYHPPRPQWKRPPNFLMLKGKKKSNKQRSKTRFDCSECGKRFLTNANLRNHFHSVHGKFSHILSPQSNANAVASSV